MKIATEEEDFGVLEKNWVANNKMNWGFVPDPKQKCT